MINKKLGYNNEIIQCECNGVTVSMTGENTYHINFLNGSLDLDLNKKGSISIRNWMWKWENNCFLFIDVNETA